MPRQYLNYMGVANSEEESHAPDRATFAAYFEDVMRVVTAVAPLDRAADYMAQELAHVRLPPLLTRAQRKQQYACAENNPLGEGTVQDDMEEGGRALQDGSSGSGGVCSTPVQLSLGRAGKQRLRQKASAAKSAKKMKKKLMKKTGGKMDTEECAALDVLQAEAAADGEDALLPLEALTADSMVRLAAAGCARILPLEDTIHVCHMMRNHPNAPYDRQVIEFDQDCGVAIEAVFLAYPKYVRVGGLPFDEVGMSKSDARTERVRICTVLYENGILLARPGKSGGE